MRGSGGGRLLRLVLGGGGVLERWSLPKCPRRCAWAVQVCLHAYQGIRTHPPIPPPLRSLFLAAATSRGLPAPTPTACLCPATPHPPTHPSLCRAMPARSNFKGSAGYVKSFLRKGQALMGMSCNREAAATLDAGARGHRCALGGICAGWVWTALL